jgi:transcriptional regulator with XRE-family HTH domain
MKIVAQILKQARTREGWSFRECAEIIGDRAGYTFNHSRVQRFERAGTVVDKRTQVTEAINPLYLKTIQPLTPYPLTTLKELYDGELIDLFDEESPVLGALIEQKEDELGSQKFRAECKRLGLTEEEIIEAKKGNLLSGKVMIALSSLLKVPTDEVQLAALAQLNNNLDS